MIFQENQQNIIMFYSAEAFCIVNEIKSILEVK